MYVCVYVCVYFGNELYGKVCVCVYLCVCVSALVLLEPVGDVPEPLDGVCVCVCVCVCV